MKKVNLFILLILLLSVNLFATDSIATITALRGSAIVERNDTTIKAALGTKLEKKDTVVTKDNSKLQIIFKDETIISIGKNSRFSIEEYLFDDKQKPMAKFRMIKGAIKTITGKIGKIAPEKFTVKVKTSTIGIRGTNFIVVVNNDGSHEAYCTYGAISLTINNETHIVKQGFFISISVSGKIEIKKFTSKDLKIIEKNNFDVANSKKNKTSLDAQLEDNGDLDIAFDENSDMMIEDISNTLSDMDRSIANESDVAPNPQIDGNFASPGGM